MTYLLRTEGQENDAPRDTLLGCQHLIFSSDGAQLRLLQRELRLKELSQISLSISISVDTSRFKAVTSLKPDSS